MGFMPKPDAAAYDSVVAAGGVEPARSRDVRRHRPQPGPGPRPGHDHGVAENRCDPGASTARLMDVRTGDIDHETDNLTQFLHSIRI